MLPEKPQNSMLLTSVLQTVKITQFIQICQRAHGCSNVSRKAKPKSVSTREQVFKRELIQRLHSPDPDSLALRDYTSNYGAWKVTSVPGYITVTFIQSSAYLRTMHHLPFVIISLSIELQERVGLAQKILGDRKEEHTC